jgi:ribonuclease HI
MSSMTCNLPAFTRLETRHWASGTATPVVVERLEDHAVNVFTDGSSLQGPRRGGYAFVYVTVDEDGQEVVDEFSPDGCAGANNQEMELKACVEALKLLAGHRTPVDLERFSKIVIYTDSTFVHKHFDTAKFQWSTNRWMRRSGPPVLHAHLWKDLVGAVKRVGLPVYVDWVRGKSSKHTKRVDKLAKDSAKRPFGRAPSVRSVRRKRTSKSVETGSVGVEGQEIDIQIMTAEYQRVQRCCRYKYEVISEDSPYAGNVDFVFSDEALRHSYIYRVRLNEDPNYPQIAEVVDVIGPARRGSEPTEIETD